MDVGFILSVVVRANCASKLGVPFVVLESYCFKVLLRKSGIVSDSDLLNCCNDFAN